VIIPVINKIDLPSAQPDVVADDIHSLLGVDPDSILRISAKDGTNVAPLLEEIVQKIPHPSGDPDLPLRALIFDSHYDSYKGVIAYVRIFEGTVLMTDTLRMMMTGIETRPVEIGVFSPTMRAVEKLTAGDVGYLATGLKTVSESRVGDTVTLAARPASQALPGYMHAKPMVFAGIYPVDNDNYQDLKEALEKLQLNDASLSYQTETSQALNFGFRCGFLGLFHMEIIQERLEREYDLDILMTAPSVEYEVEMMTGEILLVDSPVDLPEEGLIKEIREPWMTLQIITPTEFYGTIMDLVTKRRGI